MKYPISLTLFFPVYNEEENIQELIAHTVKVVESSPYIREYEVLIINDGSTDRTAQVAERLTKEYPNVRLISHAKNKGYGAALRTGIAEAAKDYIFFTDADLQFDIRELNNLIVHLEDYGDMVVGYRAPRRDPLMRRLNAWGWNVLNRVLFGLRIRDIDCAFKLFKRELVQQMRLRSRGAMINAELLIRLQRAGVPVKEVPVSHLPRKRGAATGAKPSVILRALSEMADLYRGELGSVTQKQALKFAAVGMVNTLVDMGVYVLLTRGVGLSVFVFAKFLSFMTGTVSSLMLNRYWTFGLRTRITAAELVRFYTMVSLTLAANLSAMFVSVRVFSLPDLVGLVIATGVSLGASYTLSRFWVFRPQEQVRHTPSRFAFPSTLLSFSMVVLIAASALFWLSSSVAHAAEGHGNPHVQHAEQSQPATPAAPTSPSDPITVASSTQPTSHASSTDPYPIVIPTVEPKPAHQPKIAPGTSATPVQKAATSTKGAAPKNISTTTAAQISAAGDPPGSASVISSLKEILSPSGTYPSAHLSTGTTRVLMLIAGLFAATGVVFLTYGALAASAGRRAARRRFRHVPIAVR